MLTFTMPEELRPFCRSHQRAAYGAMFRAASRAIKKLTQDPRFMGADLPGFTAVLHTWGRQMQYHPHLHLIVPGGGLSKDRKQWLPSAKNFYLPAKGLSKIFRGKFKTEMVRRELIGSIDPAVWKIDWNVNSQAVGDGEASYKYKESNRPRQTNVDTIEFIRRFLQHVLPTGFMKVRHYGFMSSSCPISRSKLRLMVLSVLAALQGERVSLTDLALQKDAKAPMPKPKCRLCGGVLMYLFSLIPGRPCRGST